MENASAVPIRAETPRNLICCCSALNRNQDITRYVLEDEKWCVSSRDSPQIHIQTTRKATHSLTCKRQNQPTIAIHPHICGGKALRIEKHLHNIDESLSQKFSFKLPNVTTNFLVPIRAETPRNLICCSAALNRNQDITRSLLEDEEWCVSSRGSPQIHIQITCKAILPPLQEANSTNDSYPPTYLWRKGIEN
ncbi:hypothetical protein CEXT_523631 [Caerostris extrusa]|uniref:Uncharacterized protein n=1 Tax=Caerostris extrusa TaxID=172846 RepID=A0AAV4RD87_CAEEX|nr:hypothetical protein CEXT_523631 [Caerostris extrusa]